MPGGASKLRDFNKLSDAGAVLDLSVGLDELLELPQLVVGGGPLKVLVSFGREQAHIVARVEVEGKLQLVCQRCMRPMDWPVKTLSPVVLIEAESQADRAPAEYETFLAADGRVSVAALASEELLLALPIVPMHANAADCHAAAAPVDEAPAEMDTARPFADLRALLERSAKPKI